MQTSSSESWSADFHVQVSQSVAFFCTSYEMFKRIRLMLFFCKTKLLILSIRALAIPRQKYTLQNFVLDEL